MRITIALLTFIGLVAGALPAGAEITYPWCAQYGDRGTRNCGFSTYEQCRWALSGNGGYCIENPMYQPVAGQSRKVRRY
jgi:Protein of unknown function (DUF3551)